MDPAARGWLDPLSPLDLRVVVVPNRRTFCFGLGIRGQSRLICEFPRHILKMKKYCLRVCNIFSGLKGNLTLH